MSSLPTSFLEPKFTESASVWLTPWEELYKYLCTIQYNEFSKIKPKAAWWHVLWK